MQLAILPARFPLDAHEPIKMHPLGLEPRLQRFSRLRAKLHEHFPFQHIDQYAFRMSGSAGLHPLHKVFRALPR